MAKTKKTTRKAPAPAETVNIYFSELKRQYTAATQAEHEYAKEQHKNDLTFDWSIYIKNVHIDDLEEELYLLNKELDPNTDFED